ncbi:MAG: tRNA (adenosine(37)-N6)-dimethylallyltransferase MiaA [Rickettsiales bacterium]|nr:tRNA (adenosine(37)-N6)-dimethylallyltransferase MiaA [Rickettsiales bacterium]
MSHLQSVYVITGPTCSGKSAYALELAQKQNGVIINADAMQLYRELPRLTAQPTVEEMQQVPHRLYAVLDGEDICTAARWVSMAAEEIQSCWSAGALPLLVGGSGMYLQALMQGIAKVPAIPLTLRTELRARMKQEGNAAFHAWFSQNDPVMGARLNAGDTQRVLRAAEVWAATGQSLAVWQKAKHQPLLPQATYRMFAIGRPRAQLYERINARFRQMLEAGALIEVQTLAARQLSTELPVMRSHGVPELLAYLSGSLTLEAAIHIAQQNTRHYAKRQSTWIRHQFPNAEPILL